MRNVLALKEEWDVFKVLCPKELMDIYTDENITSEKSIAMINTLNALGFFSLANELTNLREDDIEEEITTDLCLKDTIFFIKQFLDNIKSDGLRERFSKTVKNFMNAEQFYEINRTFWGIREEWELFNILCPKEYKDIIKQEDISINDYMKFILALENLGFSNIADNIYLSEYAERFEKDEIDPTVFLILPEFIKVFLDNIKSNGLKQVFSL